MAADLGRYRPRAVVAKLVNSRTVARVDVRVSGADTPEVAVASSHGRAPCVLRAVLRCRPSPSTSRTPATPPAAVAWLPQRARAVRRGWAGCTVQGPDDPGRGLTGGRRCQRLRSRRRANPARTRTNVTDVGLSIRPAVQRRFHGRVVGAARLDRRGGAELPLRGLHRGPRGRRGHLDHCLR